MIKNVILDIGEVLVRFAPMDSIRYVGVPADLEQKILEATVNSRFWEELDKGILEENEVIEKMVQDCPENEEYIRKFFENGKEVIVETYDYALKWILNLKKRGYKVYILSNYPKSYYNIHVECGKLSFLKCVDGKIISALVKKVKPELDIYKLLLKKYNLKAEECVFIDDKLENVLAAEKLGINVIRFENYEETKEVLERMLDK